MKSGKRWAVRAGVVLSMAIPALAVSPAGWAAGDTVYTVDTTDANPGGEARFYSYGEKFYVVDAQQDGYRAVGFLWANGVTYRVDDANGGAQQPGGVTKDFSFAEGTTVMIEVCLRDGADGVNKWCSDWKTGTA